MGKIKKLKNNWIEIENRAINLNSFSNITKGQFGIDEAGDDKYFIEVTELHRNADSSENKYMITTYKENEKTLWEEDYSNIIAANNS